ncbi:MAG TPA: hypothetical protein VMR34_03190 [Candidatus Saccharimonadales bacterium]|nr:hypothetical protein [Candidatus Saccharimonadales bacterium]
MEQARQRVLSFEQAARTFAMQLQIFPELLDEVTALSSGKIGVLNAVMETVTDEISYSPMEETTPQRIRSIVGAPSETEQLDEWRGNSGTNTNSTVLNPKSKKLFFKKL